MHRHNPWIAMWRRPREAIRSVVETNPRYGIWYLATGYMLQTLLFYANFYSLGLWFSTLHIALASLLAAPLLGLGSLYIAGWVLRFAVRLVRGHASQESLRAVWAWSKLPELLALILWALLLLGYGNLAFINYMSTLQIAALVGSSVILGSWSFVLLVAAVAEVAHFSIARACVAIGVAWLIYWFLLFLLMLISRLLFLLFQ